MSFAIAPASHTVLLGLNGAGKSALLSLVTRLFATQRGAIRIFGHDVARAPGEALRILGVVAALKVIKTIQVGELPWGATIARH